MQISLRAVVGIGIGVVAGYAVARVVEAKHVGVPVSMALNPKHWGAPVSDLLNVAAQQAIPVGSIKLPPPLPVPPDAIIQPKMPQLMIDRSVAIRSGMGHFRA